MRHQLLFALGLSLAIFSPLAAQANPELIIEATIGSPLQGQIIWLDDARLLVGTSAETRLYEPSSSTEAIYTIPVGGNFSLIDGEIVLDGRRWDSATGELLGETNVIKSWETEDDSLQANVLADGSVEIRSGDSISLLPIPEDYTFSHIVFNPDGIRAAIVFHQEGYWEDNELLQLWNLQTAEKIADLPVNLNLIGMVAFYANGQNLVTRAFDEDGYFYNIGFWDTTTGSLLGMPDNYKSPVISPDTQWVAYMDYDGINLWKSSYVGKIKRPNCEGECEAYSDFTFSPDSRFILGIYDEGIDVWDLETIEGNQIPESPSRTISNEYAAHYLLFMPDGQSFLTYSGDTTIHLIDFETGELLLSFPPQGSIGQLEFSPDGRWLRADKSLLWDTSPWEGVVQLARNTVLNPSWTKAVYWDEANLVLSDSDTGLIQTLPIIEDYRGLVVGMNPNEEWVAFKSQELQFYRITTDELFFTRRVPIAARVMMSDDNAIIVSYMENYQRNIRKYSFDEPNNPINQAHTERPYDYGGDILYLEERGLISELATGCGDGRGGYQLLYDANTGELIAEAPTWACGPYDQVLMPDGNFLIVAWDWSLFALNIRQDPIPLGENGFSYAPTGIYNPSALSRDVSMTVSNNGSYLALNQEHCDSYEAQLECPDYSIDILHINTNPATPEDFAELMFSIPNEYTAVFSPDSQFILSNTSLWSITGTEIINLPNQAAAFDPSGNWLVSYNDNELLLWDWAQVQTGNAAPLHRLPVAGITKLAFNSDGSFLYAQRAGDVLRIKIQIPQT